MKFRTIHFWSSVALLFLMSTGFSQTYTSFFTGDVADVSASVMPGTVLMGGARENDNAMRWFLNRAGGGDIVVIRVTGSNGYNNYLYSELGVNVNSVETLIIPSVEAANHPYVIQQLQNAEAIWIAGGDQFNYVNFWKNTAVETILNNHVNVKRAPIGGTSAGMAILGGTYFTAENGTVTSSVALANPFDSRVSLGYNDFLNVPFLQQVVTDTHYDNPNRKGRHITFLARMTVQTGIRAFGIACEEFTAVCIDASGKAVVFGNYPANDDVAYFLQTNCDAPFTPENLTPGAPLNWNRNNQAVKVYAVKGTQTAEHFFQLSDWKTGSGGMWEHWYVINGLLQTTNGTSSTCSILTTIRETNSPKIHCYPNPTRTLLNINGLKWNETYTYQILDLNGKAIVAGSWSNGDRKQLNVASLHSGNYLLQISTGPFTYTHTFIVSK